MKVEVDQMLDIRILRENPELVKNDLMRRGDQEKVGWVDQILEQDSKRRELIVEIDKLRHLRNLVTDEIAVMRRRGEDASAKLAEAKAIPGRIKELENQMIAKEERVNWILHRFPNLMHESVPTGKDENDNVLVRTWGEKPQFDFKLSDHIDIGLRLNLIDIERAAKVSGARFYYLKNEAVTLEFALIQMVLNILREEGFTLVIPPVLVKEKAMFGAGFLPLGEEDIYWIKGEDTCLVGTSEIPLAAMHMEEILDESSLPLYYAGFSTCFRTEAGAHGRDTKGIFRVHQFEKIEMFKYTRPEDSWTEHEKMINTVEKLYQKLDLHYRIVNVCSGELGVTAAKKYDLEVWLPGQGKFRELVSCSNCTDYQARRLNIRCRKNPNDKPRFVHTLNSTAMAIERTIVAILENYQNKDGSVTVPEALVPYAGITCIGR
jgi:seryl-tRNA synthetase